MIPFLKKSPLTILIFYIWAQMILILKPQREDRDPGGRKGSEQCSLDYMLRVHSTAISSGTVTPACIACISSSVATTTPSAWSALFMVAA